MTSPPTTTARPPFDEASYGAPTAEPSARTVSLTADQIEAIHAEALETYPEECCGILIGRTSDSETRVERLLTSANDSQEDRRRRFVISPELVLRAEKGARADGLEIVGYYHSHPDCPAKPSETDREFAWPGLSYLIVPVHDGQPGQARSWRLTDDRSAYSEERVCST